MLTDTITLYNHYTSEGVEAWHRTVLEGVQARVDSTMSVDREGRITNVSELNVTIPYDERYVQPIEYVGSGFTFGLDNLDIIVLGKSEIEVSDESELSMLMQSFQHTGTITQVNDNTNRSLLKHWKVIAR